MRWEEGKKRGEGNEEAKKRGKKKYDMATAFRLLSFGH